jgi:uncharacterized protein YjbJ (UPF0337 family)
MNKDQLSGEWKQFKGKILEKWGKLTNDDLDVISGKREQLLGKLQQRYGVAREEAERQVKEWESGNTTIVWIREREASADEG